MLTVIHFKRIEEYSKSDEMSLPKLGYEKTVTSLLLSALDMREASCHVVSNSMDKTTQQGTAVSGHRLAKDLKPTTSHVSEPERRFLPTSASGCSLY